MTEFQEFAKITRLNREIVVSEKIDGTNAQIVISDDGNTIEAVGSRNRYVTTEDDHFGFAKWVQAHNNELLLLGPGRHYGEWYGARVGRRNYGLTEKRLALFNTHRWTDPTTRPACVGVVPILYQGPFSEAAIKDCLERLRTEGSRISPGFMKPEGVVIYHTHAHTLFKVTLEKDEIPKSLHQK